MEYLWRSGVLLALPDLNLIAVLAKNSLALPHHACVVVLVSSVSSEVGLCSYWCYQCADNCNRTKLAPYYELCIYLFQLFTLNVLEGTKV